MRNRGIEINTRTKLVTEQCYLCHILFAMPAEMQERCLQYGNTFFCPNGHSQAYIKSELQQLREELRSTKGYLANASDRLDGTLKALRGKDTELKQIKRRVHVGICPYCKRHFTNVERHIHSKHQEAQSG